MEINYAESREIPLRTSQIFAKLSFLPPRKLCIKSKWSFQISCFTFRLPIFSARTLTHFEIETSLQTLFRLSSRMQLFLATTQRAAVSLCSTFAVQILQMQATLASFTSNLLHIVHCKKRCKLTSFTRAMMMSRRRRMDWKKGEKNVQEIFCSFFFLCNESSLWVCRRLDNVRGSERSL